MQFNSKISVIALVSATLSAGAALADGPAPVVYTPAPTPPAEMYDWAGAYVGLSFGMVDPRADSNVGAFNDDPFNEDSAFGVFAGYQMQNGNLVYGGELGYTAYEAEAVNFPGEFIEDIIEVRARLGYAFDNVLVHGSVGWASQTYSAPGFAIEFDMTGMIYGIGVDVGLTDNLFVGLEYVIRDIEVSQAAPAAHVAIEDQSFRFRIGYSF